MVEEYGTVVELKGKMTAVVLCEKSTMCNHCASMEACRLGADNTTRLVEVNNPIGAAVGDKVRIQVSSRTFLQSSFLLYIVPLIALFIGAVAGQLVGSALENGPDPNLLAALIGTAFMVGSFFIIRIGSRAIPPETFMPRITEIISGEETAPKS